MNRRTTIKGMMTFGLLSISSYSAFKWFDFHRKVDPKLIMAHKTLIAELAETIIPLTDTPGAKAAKAENYIVNVLINCSSKLEQNIFIHGLYDLEAYVKVKFNKDFFQCTLNERIETLSYFEKKGNFTNGMLNKVRNKLLGVPFFEKLKTLTVQGYCLSELGATRGLAYEEIPGSYQGCIPLEPNQKSWATK